MSSFNNKSPFTFQAPNKFNAAKFNNGKFSNDMLFNKKKISSDVLSMSSASSASSSSASSRSSVSSKSSASFKENRADDASSSISGKDDYQKQYDDEDFEDDSHESVEDEDDDVSLDEDREPAVSYENSKKDKKQMIMNELNEKRELLYQMDRLESKGYRLPFKFNMESDLHEMKAEYNKLIREKEVDASIRFQRKMLMAFVTGTEYLNTRYDPFSIRLEGWSEQVHENLTDYDDIFEELHTKYKSTGKKMSPELRLLISLSGSAFMFHLTNRMFKENPLPDVENVLRSNPELMKQFQQAAAKQYITGQGGLPPGQNTRGQQGNQGPMGGPMGGIFGMVSNLFNNLGGGPSRMQQRMPRDDDETSNSSLRRKLQHKDIDNIIHNVHSKISFEPEQNNIETLSVSDEEITSIIEDTADIKILTGKKNRKNTRTLNL